MIFTTSDPDIETILGRIRDGSYDLQPDFQRGEVWSRGKQQRLIDTILRGWHIPPIHLVASDGIRLDVLDGQQRLTAIRDFAGGAYGVDGGIQPFAPEIEALDGLRFDRLPTNVRKNFMRFTIRLLTLHNFQPDEPHELFFRLNQPTNLTEAEKRNAFIGGPRNQIRELAKWAEHHGMSRDTIGFSNSRMAYDDLLARFLVTLEQANLTEKITAQRVTDRYRTNKAFSEDLLKRARTSVRFLVDTAKVNAEASAFKPNKATAHTWLCMVSELLNRDDLDRLREPLAQTMGFVESNRSSPQGRKSAVAPVLAIFNDRATSRVADVSSVILRDLTAWMTFAHLYPALEVPDDHPLALARTAWPSLDSSESGLGSFAVAARWGENGWI